MSLNYQNDKRTDERIEYLIYGYIHNLEKNYNFYMVISKDIYNTILLFYPTLIKFELFDSSHFELLNDGYEIRGKEGDCKGYTIYPETLNMNGFSKGIHFWSVKLLGIDFADDFEDDFAENYCYHSIGVVPNERKIEPLSNHSDEWQYEYDKINGIQKSTSTSFWSGNKCGWNRDDIITVKLNCNEWNVEYYKNDEFKRNDKIDSDKSYFFAMNSCDSEDNWFQIVPIPQNIP